MEVDPETAREVGVAVRSGVSRATVYRHRRPTEPAVRKKPGPLGAMADEALVAAIRQLLQDSPFHGEGYRKVWARLRHQGIRTASERVRRLMREHQPGEILCSK